MNIPTRSQFYFGYEVNRFNNLLDFSESTSPLVSRVAVLVPGYYSATEFVAELSRAFTEAGSQIYSFSFNRITRIISVSSTVSFTLKTNTGLSAGAAAWTIIGMDTISDQSGTTISGVSASGFIYRPQFWLLDYVPSRNIKRSVEATVTETGSGKTETYRFGNKNFMECKISFINDYPMASDSFIEQNLNGYSEALFFLEEITKKGNIEFMEDRDDPATFEILKLESTTEDSKGLGFRLTEEFNYGAGFYTTGRLVFRKV